MDDEMQHLGRLLIIFGGVIVVAGVLMMLAGKLPWVGRLPGDIVLHRKNFTFYFPLATSILISLLLTLLFWILGKR
ncbi:MAG TPA: DUF2905 domain-containing protein [Candidatus Sulfobium mesophilum]|jgi:hypothetical protein|nr:DUF2905 domain-containing protein [Candidatus Sulfobium mesophilum]